MDVIAFLQNSLKEAWVIIGISALVFAVSWIVSQRISKRIMSSIKNSATTTLITQRIKIRKVDSASLWLQKALRAPVIFLGAWAAWSILNSHPEISKVIGQGIRALSKFIQIPIVALVLNIALIGLATFILSRSFRWVKIAFDNSAHYIETDRSKRFKGFKIQGVEIVSAGQITNFLLGLNLYIRYIVNILLIPVYLTGIFSIFPQTRGMVTGILNSFFEVVQKNWWEFLNYLPNLFNLIVIIVVTHYSLKLIGFIFNEIEKGTITFSGIHPEAAVTTYQLARFFVIFLAFVISFPYLPGSSSPAFQGISVFVGLLFSLGSTSVIANIVSGVVLTYARAFRVGDRVQIADTTGDVTEKGLLVTQVRTVKNVEVTIPNAMVLASHIVNYSFMSQEMNLILHTTMAFDYNVPWRLIHEALIKAAQRTNGIMAEPSPYVLQTALDYSFVNYELNAYTDQPNKMTFIYSELHQNIQDCCIEAGIKASPTHYNPQPQAEEPKK